MIGDSFRVTSDGSSDFSSGLSRNNESLSFMLALFFTCRFEKAFCLLWEAVSHAFAMWNARNASRWSVMIGQLMAFGGHAVRRGTCLHEDSRSHTLQYEIQWRFLHEAVHLKIVSVREGANFRVPVPQMVDDAV